MMGIDFFRRKRIGMSERGVRRIRLLAERKDCSASAVRVPPPVLKLAAPMKIHVKTLLLKYCYRDTFLILRFFGVSTRPELHPLKESTTRGTGNKVERKDASGMRGPSGSSRKLALLAPSASSARLFFNRVYLDAPRTEDLLAEMQAMRGSIYLQDGAIGPGDLTNGRYQLDEDEGSWHLLVLDKQDRVCGCARYREHSNATGFSQLTLSRSALAHSGVWGPKLQRAVEGELALSRLLNLPYVECGGWALLKQIRGTGEAFRMVMATYGLAQVLGGAIGISTVTYRNGSVSILKRMGGRPLKCESLELPPYHDPRYRCEMEVLRFRSWAPNPRFKVWIDRIKADLRDIPVLTKGAAGRAFVSPVPRHSLASNALYHEALTVGNSTGMAANEAPFISENAYLGT